MVYPVSWTAVCYVTVLTLFIKKELGWSVQKKFFWGGGVRTPDPPVVAPLVVTEFRAFPYLCTFRHYACCNVFYLKKYELYKTSNEIELYTSG